MKLIKNFIKKYFNNDEIIENKIIENKVKVFHIDENILGLEYIINDWLSKISDIEVKSIAISQKDIYKTAIILYQQEKLLISMDDHR